MKIFELINGLSSLSRWSHAFCVRPETVLEHTGFVAMYSLHLCAKYKIDHGDAITSALLHDVEEYTIGDIPTPTKYSNNTIRDEIQKLAKVAAAEICNDYFSRDLFDSWYSAKDLSTDSGCVVAIADAAAVVNKIQVEVGLGNRSFMDYRRNIGKSLDRLREEVTTKLIPEVVLLIDLNEEIR